MAMSQKAVIVFDEKSFDFGKVKEEVGKITHVFYFTNKGNTALVINSAKATCGCTTPIWTKEPVEPGKKGSVTVTYTTIGRPDTFSKTVTIYSNATEEQSVLLIRGEVLPKQDVENNPYPFIIGALKLSSKVIQINNVEKGKTQLRTIDIMNQSKSVIVPKIENLPSYIKTIVSPQSLKPNEEGKIAFTFDSKKCRLWGPVSNDVYVSINGNKKLSDEYKILILGNVIEDFSRMTMDQKRKAPILEMPERTLNFGTLDINSKKSGVFNVFNKGLNLLEFRRIVNLNNEFAVSTPNNSIGGGKSGVINVNLDTKGLGVGDYKKSFLIQTNDPESSSIILIVSWTVK
jgi:hypothetical protein